MARLRSSGGELNATTADVEFTNVNNSGGASLPTIVSSPVRSGTYSIRCNNSGTSGSSYITLQLGSSTGINKYFFLRSYVYIADLPAATQNMITISDGGGVRELIKLTSAGVLQLFDDGGAQVGSNSSALSLNTWYRVEVKCDMTTSSGNVIAEALLDGASFASGTYGASAGVNRIEIGGQLNTTSYDYYFDDLAINNSTGSFQNSYPGEGKIIHLKPNAAGDNSAWTNDYLSVDEVTPDDATTLVSSNTLDQIDDHDIESPTSLGASDTINVVQVGVRFNGVGASANASFVLRIKATASGTVEESSAITPANTTYVTNAAAAPRNYSLTLYDLPGGSTTVWTKADLDTAQIGYRLSATSTNAAQISTVWLLVDYAAAGGGTPSISTMLMMGV